MSGPFGLRDFFYLNWFWAVKKIGYQMLKQNLN